MTIRDEKKKKKKREEDLTDILIKEFDKAVERSMEVVVQKAMDDIFKNFKYK